MGNCFSSDKNETGDQNNSDAVPAKSIETGMVNWCTTAIIRLIRPEFKFPAKIKVFFLNISYQMIYQQTPWMVSSKCHKQQKNGF